MPLDSSSLLKALDDLDEDVAEAARRQEPLYYQHGVAPKYMLDRGFALATLKAWDVGWDADNSAVVLPAKEAGDVVGLIRRFLKPGTKKYKNSEGFKPGDRGHLFGLDFVTTDWVIIVEGPMDAMWLWQCGLPAVAILGAALSPRQEAEIRRRFWRVVIATDADKAGERVANDIKKALTGLWTQRLKPDRGLKDVQESSAEYLLNAVENLPVMQV